MPFSYISLPRPLTTMSEDSIASDSISCRTEAPLLPPRKRLLAGLKQNGWSSPSSSSCAAAPMENLQVIETLPLSSIAKLEEVDQNSTLDASDRGSLQSLNSAVESVDSQQRKSKRQRASSLLKNSSNKRKKVSPEDEPVKDTYAKDLSGVAEKVKASDAMPLPAVVHVEGEEDVDAAAGTVSSEAEKHAITSTEREAEVEKKEDGEALVEHVIALKRALNPIDSTKEEEEVSCDEANKPSRNPSIKAKKGETRISHLDEAQKPRRNPNRQHNSRSKDADQKKQEVQQERNSQTPLALADEELARQLHRAMNSSPRIARCLSHKQERPLLSPSRKRYPGS